MIMLSGDLHGNAMNELTAINSRHVANKCKDPFNIHYHIILGDCGFLFREAHKEVDKNDKYLQDWFAEKNYICAGKVVHDQLPLNSPRAGRQQGQEVVAVRCTKLSLFFNELLKRTTSRSAFYCRSDTIHFRLDILS